MNITHLHLILNNVPILGSIFCTLLFMIALILKNIQFQRVSCIFLVIIAISAIPTYLSGQKSEDIVEKLPGTLKDAIEDHEHAALPALITIEITGVAALTFIIASTQFGQYSKYLATAILILSLISALLLLRTAYMGGHIRHPELRPGFQVPL